MEDIYIGGEVPVSSTPRIEPTESAKVASAKKIENDSEEKTKLKRDIESIDSLIEDKKRIVKANEDKWYYKHSKKLSIFILFIILGLILSVPLLLILASLNVLSTRLMFSIMLFEAGLYVPVVILPAALLDKAKVFSKQNGALLIDVEYLVAIKKQKSCELELLKKQASADMNLPVKTQSKTRSKIEIYQEVLKIIQSMTDTPSPEMVEGVRQVVEEIEQHSRQKTLTNLERN